MNKVILIGRLTKDVELKSTTKEGKEFKYCYFDIALNEFSQNEKRTIFINCCAFGTQAENLSKYCSKGSLICLNGKINVYDSNLRIDKNNTKIIKKMIVLTDVIEYLSKVEKKETKEDSKSVFEQDTLGLDTENLPF